MTDDNGIHLSPPRELKTQYGITQQSDEAMAWLRDAKFGLFIHWGLYAGPGQGEWYMHQSAVPPDEYRKLASPESGESYFAADRFDPGQWAQIAKDAGMKWMCLTTRHHDGYCLFESPHPNAFSSMQTHKRDFVKEYVEACRGAGLKVGLYYSPLSWRYPGYYDVTGTDCKPNPFGYKTDHSHKESARLMKEENCANVRHLVTSYGRIDHIYWDGGWLAEQGSDADAAFFHEPGLFMDPTNPWPVSADSVERDPLSGQAFGIMGVTRKHQPQVVVNPRYGWIGDFGDEEGQAHVVGPVRAPFLVEKCMTTQADGAWGYKKADIDGDTILQRDDIISYLANCVVRDMVLLLNIGPDRHGEFPEPVVQPLLKVGKWLAVVGEAIYGTRGGPWPPTDGQVGYCYKGNTIYAHLFQGFAGSTMTLPPIGPLRPVRAYDAFTGAALEIDLGENRTPVISGLDRTANPVDTIVAIDFDRPIMTYAISSK